MWVMSCVKRRELIDQIKTQLRMGHPELRLLYVTPETLFSAKISHDLRIAYDQKQLSRLVIDEVSFLSCNPPC